MLIRIRHDHYIHMNPAEDSEVVNLLKDLKIINTKIMGELEDINAQLDRIDTAHVEIKKDLDFVKAKLEAAGSGSLPAADVQILKARITATADKLAALDAETDSSEPVVPPEEEV